MGPFRANTESEMTQNRTAKMQSSAKARGDQARVNLKNTYKSHREFKHAADDC